MQKVSKVKVWLIALLITVSSSEYSFSQLVPRDFYFADIQIKLTPKLQSEIQAEVDALTRSPKYFQIKVDRANLYFPIIEQIFKEENVPDDIKYLVLQESALIADAVSVSNAVGYWQFKEFTAKEMGLRVDKVIDERMNIVSSSRAAAKYMKKNNMFFDNWLHALQAYQMGAGGAMKALTDRYNGSKKMTLDNKTYWYVKKYLAHKFAFQSAINPSDSDGHLMEYKVNDNTTLKQIASETYIGYEDLQEYNKWVRGNKIPAGKTYAVILPMHGEYVGTPQVAQNSDNKVSASQYSDINENPEGYPQIKATRNTQFQKINGISGIVAGEDLDLNQVLRENGLTDAKFRKYNEILPHEELISGMVYYLKSKKSKAKEYYHILQEGQSLWEVSQIYGVKLKKLLQKNRIKKAEDAKPGLVVWLRNIRPSKVQPEYRQVNKVVPVEVDEEVNNEEIIIQDTSFDSVPIEVSESDLSSESDTVVYHIIKKGETLYRISKMYHVDLMTIVDDNQLNLQEPLKLGRTLTINGKKESMKNEVASIEETQQIEESPITTEVEEAKEMSNDLSFVKYEVKAGDTYYKIAKEFGVKVSEIKSWNKKTNDYLSPGDVLLIQSN